jgi:hypothetical protein
MATNPSQRRWRAKHRLVKSQLNVMARKQVHDALEELALGFDLRGKAEAVTFACFVVRGLIQRAEYSASAADMLRDFVAGYHRDREVHAP